MELEDVAGRVDRLGAEVTGAATRLARADPGSRVFAGDGPGALFAAGRALHDEWLAALAAREREAAAHGARLAGLADGLRAAAARYRAAEDAATRALRDAAGATGVSPPGGATPSRPRGVS
jgi:hypothetical protein